MIKHTYRKCIKVHLVQALIQTKCVFCSMVQCANSSGLIEYLLDNFASVNFGCTEPT